MKVVDVHLLVRIMQWFRKMPRFRSVRLDRAVLL
jgi:hypothetical protein